MQKLTIICLMVLGCFTFVGQNSDTKYAESLDQALQKISKQYHITLS